MKHINVDYHFIYENVMGSIIYTISEIQGSIGRYTYEGSSKDLDPKYHSKAGHHWCLYSTWSGSVKNGEGREKCGVLFMLGKVFNFMFMGRIIFTFYVFIVRHLLYGFWILCDFYIVLNGRNTASLKLEL